VLHAGESNVVKLLTVGDDHEDCIACTFAVYAYIVVASLCHGELRWGFKLCCSWFVVVTPT
jgi:hypothetical protein